MSARQRHSRMAMSDGWTTISSHKKSKSNSNTKSKELQSALFAHKSDLTPLQDGFLSSTTNLNNLKTRLEQQIATFNNSQCYKALTELFQTRLSQNEHDNSPPANRITNILILALGSVSDSQTSSPAYQLAAALSIISALPIPPSEIIAHDPAATTLDAHVLSLYNITAIPNSSSLPSIHNSDWYKTSLIYLPHASIWLNHKYFMLKPKVWIGNEFGIYDIKAEKGSEVDVILREVEELMEGYEKLGWPDEEFGGGAVFNNLVIYVRTD